MKALLGRKLGMTQIISDDGALVPVTLVQAGPCTVTQIKTTEQDGYKAVQFGFGKAKHTAKPQAGHLKDAKVSPVIMREVRVTDEEVAKVGDSFDVDVFEIGDAVKVTGTSKGKGFAGTVKRHNFNTSKNTHGGNGNVRKPGSIGSMYPQKVFKGKKMAGRMGGDTVTTSNLKVMLVDTENHVIGVKGAVPGPRKGLVMIQENA